MPDGDLSQPQAVPCQYFGSIDLWLSTACFIAPFIPTELIGSISFVTGSPLV